MTESTKSYVVSNSGDGADFAYRVGMKSLEDESMLQDVGLFHRIERIPGVGACQFDRQADAAAVIIEVAGANRAGDMGILARVIRFLQTQGLHSGRVHGPLAARVQHILDEMPPLPQRPGQ